MATLACFLIAMLCGLIAVLLLNDEDKPVRCTSTDYSPSILEHEVAGLLQPHELEIGAFLVEQEGLVGLTLRDQRPS